jgi:STE24 endopeptidase
MAEHDLLFYAFVVLFGLDFLIERTLATLNAERAASFRGKKPAELNGLVDDATFEKSIDYTLARTRFGHVAAIYSAALTIFILFFGIIPALSMPGQVMIEKDIGFIDERWTGVIAILGLVFLTSFLKLPLSLYSTFVLEKRFGFNKTTLGTFIADRLKGLLLSLVLGVPFLWVIMWLVTWGNPFWWLYAALFVIAFQFVMMILGPLVIMPLFYKFSPLPDGELKRALDALSERCQFAVSGLFVMDGSRRSAHSNAFFTGFGKARRIVLFDTLIAQLSVPELEAVLAHEIGHYKRKHILKSLVLSCALTVAGFWVVSLVLDWHPLYQAFGLGGLSPEKGLIALMLISGAFTFWLDPLFNWLSRKHEYEADAYAKEHTAAEPMSGALLKLFEKNLANYVPHPWYSAWTYSHPTLLERLNALKR